MKTYVTLFIVLPMLWAITVSLGAADTTELIYESIYNNPDNNIYSTGPAFWAGLTAALGGAIALISTCVLLSYWGYIADQWGKIHQQDKVVAAYQSQVDKLKKECDESIKDQNNGSELVNLPTGKLIKQLGKARESLAKAEATKANAYVGLEQCAQGPMGFLVTSLSANMKTALVTEPDTPTT